MPPNNAGEATKTLEVNPAAYNPIFEASPVAMLILDESTKIIMANAASVAVCGGNEADVVGHRPGDALHCVKSFKDPRGCGYSTECPICPVRKGIEAVLRDGGSIKGAEIEMDLARGGIPRKVWLNLDANPLVINGKPHLCAALEDISERKLAEVELQENENKYRALFETADDAILLFVDGHWVDCNAGALNVFGCTREQIIGAHPSRFSPEKQPDGRFSEEDAIKKIGLAYTTGPQFFEWEHCRADGALFSAEVCLNRVDLKGRAYIQAIVRDISGRKRAQEELEFNAMRMKALMQINQMGGAALQEITDFTLEQAVLLTKSRIGYLAFLNSNESVLTMHAWSKSAMKECAIQDKPIIYPVADTGLWGEAVRQRNPVITNDYLTANPLIKGIPVGHVSLKRHMNVPVFDGDRIVIVAGVGNKEEPYGEDDVRQLTLLMAGMWRMLERKRVETGLKESEARYLGLLSGVPDMLVFAGMDGIITTVNRRWLEAHGFDEKDVVGRNAVEFAHPDDRERGIQHFREIMEGRNSGPREYRSIRADGTTMDIEVNGEVLRDGHGAPVGLVFIDRDISGRKERDRRDHLMQEVLDCINKADVSVDLIKTILAKIKVFTGVDAVGIRLKKGDDYPYIAQDGFSNEFLLKENSLVVLDKVGDVCRDENGKVMLECTCGLVIEGKGDPNSPLFTRGGSAWTGNSMPFLDLPLDQDPRLNPRNTCIHHGYKSIAIIPLRSGDKIIGILHMNDRREGQFTKESIEYFESIGNSIGIALSRKALEEDLLQRKNQLESVNQELESFSYSVAHDLRAPIRAMDGFSQAVLEDYGDKLAAEGRDYLTRIRGASQRMGLLIDDILKLSRLSRLEMRKEPTDLSALAESCLRNLREMQPARSVEIDVKKNLVANADPNLMRIVMENMLGNAWKFTAKTANARISFGMKEENGDKIYFVYDNGAGFDPLHADKLFGTFQRLHSVEEFEGTGIGLATVRRVVNRHGGRIWAEGRPGAGARFYFTL